MSVAGWWEIGGEKYSFDKQIVYKGGVPFKTAPGINYCQHGYLAKAKENAGVLDTGS